jgi:hypothetical protein
LEQHQQRHQHKLIAAERLLDQPVRATCLLCVVRDDESNDNVRVEARSSHEL